MMAVSRCPPDHGTRGPKTSLMLGMTVDRGRYGLSVLFIGAVWQVIAVSTVTPPGSASPTARCPP